MMMSLILFGPALLILVVSLLIPRQRRTQGFSIAVAIGCVWLAAATAFVIAVNLGWVSV